jgi:hypothetical protein
MVVDSGSRGLALPLANLFTHRSADMGKASRSFERGGRMVNLTLANCAPRLGYWTIYKPFAKLCFLDNTSRHASEESRGGIKYPSTSPLRSPPPPHPPHNHYSHPVQSTRPPCISRPSSSAPSRPSPPPRPRPHSKLAVNNVAAFSMATKCTCADWRLPAAAFPLAVVPHALY